MDVGALAATVNVWDVEDEATASWVTAFEANSGDVTAIGFGSNDERVVVGYADGTIRLWDVGTGQVVGLPLKGHSSPLRSISVSADGRRIASCDAGGAVRLWQLEGGAATGISIKPQVDLVKVAFSPSGTFFVSSGTYSVGRWEVDSGVGEVESVTGPRSFSFRHAVSSDAAFIAYVKADAVVVQDVESGDKQALPAPAHTGVNAFAVSGDGRWVALGGYDGSVEVRNVRTGVLHARWTALEHGVDYLAVDGDASRVVGGQFDGTMHLWSMEEGELWRAVEPEFYVSDVGFSADGRYIWAEGSRSGASTVRLWDISRGAPVDEGSNFVRACSAES